MFEVNILQVFLFRTKGKYLLKRLMYINEMAVTIVSLGVTS